MVTENLIVTKDDLQPGSVLRTMIEAICKEVYSIYEFGDNVEKNVNPSTANDEALDLVGSRIGCIRYESEGNESYRYRISNWIPSKKTCSREAIEEVLMRSPGVSNYSIRNFANGAGSFTVYIQAIQGSDADYVASQIMAELQSIVAEGIVVDVVIPKIVIVDIDMTLNSGVDASQIGAAKRAIEDYVTSIKFEDNLEKSRINQISMNSSKAVKSSFINSIRINGKTMFSERAKLLTGEQFAIGKININ
jgi:hypothetical protein